MKRFGKSILVFLAALLVSGAAATTAKADSFVMDPAEASLKVGAKLNVNILGKNQKATFKSSDSSIVKVTNAAKGFVKAVAPGTVTITATSKDGKTTGKTTITVYGWKNVKASKSKYNVSLTKNSNIRVTVNKTKYTVTPAKLKSNMNTLYTAFASKKSKTLTYKSTDGKKTTKLATNKSKKTVTFTTGGKSHVYTYTAKKIKTNKYGVTLKSAGGQKYYLVMTKPTSKKGSMKFYIGTKATSKKQVAEVSYTTKKFVLMAKNVPFINLSKVEYYYGK